MPLVLLNIIMIWCCSVPIVFSRHPLIPHVGMGSIKIQLNPNNHEFDVVFHCVMGNMYKSIFQSWNFRTFSKGMACKAVADRCRPSSSAATWVSRRAACRGPNCFKNTGLVSDVQGEWMNIYMNIWSFCFNDFFLFCHTSFVLHQERFEKIRGVGKGSSSKHWVVQELSFWAPPCLSHQLIHHWLDVFSFQQLPQKTPSTHQRNHTMVILWRVHVALLWLLSCKWFSLPVRTVISQSKCFYLNDSYGPFFMVKTQKKKKQLIFHHQLCSIHSLQNRSSSTEFV